MKKNSFKFLNAQLKNCKYTYETTSYPLGTGGNGYHCNIQKDFPKSKFVSVYNGFLKVIFVVFSLTSYLAVIFIPVFGCGQFSTDRQLYRLRALFRGLLRGGISHQQSPGFDQFQGPISPRQFQFDYAVRCGEPRVVGLRHRLLR